MTHSYRKHSLPNRVGVGVILLVSAAAVGCTVKTGGVTTPNGNASDDVQYFSPGPEFPLQSEAEAQKLRAAEAKAQQAARR